MAAGAVPGLDLSVPIDQLSSLSQLKAFIQNNAKPVFNFGQETARYWRSPVSTVPSGMEFSLSISDAANWTTKTTGIGFGLQASADCKLEVIQGGDAVISYVADIPPLGTTDASSATTSNLPASYTGAYLKLSLDFDIQASVSGSGTLPAGVGISGKATGGAGASLVFCHHVDNTMTLQDAVRETFEKLIFPLEPPSAAGMATNDLGQVNFHATLSASLELSYGIESYNFTGPSVDTALGSVANAANLSIPGVKIDIGASAKVGYTHSDDFTAIVQKSSDTDIFFYLMRAKKDDVNGSVGVAANVTITGTAGVVPNQAQIKQAVDSVTKGLAGDQVAAKADELAQKLNNSLTNWITNQAQKGAGLSAAWDRQTSTMGLFKYMVNLSDAAALTSSWNDLCVGDLRSAGTAGGLVLQPGSGVNHDLSKSTTLEFHFFNLFSAQDVSTYFANTSVQITETGDVKFLFDIGDERDTTVNKAMQKLRFHFVGSADAKTGADIDLYIETTAANSASDERHIGAVVGFLPSSIATTAAHDDIQAFAQSGQGTVSLICIVKRSGYSRLRCSQFMNGRPPVDQTVDEQNWDEFKDASVRLLDNDFAQFMTYALWQQYNQKINGGTVADRTAFGPMNTGFWEALHQHDNEVSLDYFCRNSARFMDLCSDLQVLTGILGQARIPDDWNRLLHRVGDMVQQDVNTDTAAAAGAAIISLCLPSDITYEKTSGTNSLTCTLTVS